MIQKFFKSKRSILGVELNDWLLVAVAVSVFVAITFWTITKSSIWFDEGFGAYMIKYNFWDIAKYTANDVHPPMYYWLLKIWSMLFGNTELALRSMSTFFGGIAIVFGYLLSNKLFGKVAARFSLIFLALSPMLVRYGQEARMYTLVTSITIAATYVLTIAVNSKKKLPWIIYGILVGLGMWVHYFTAIIWIAHWIWRADNVRRVARSGEFLRKFFSKDWVMAHVIAVALYVPWLPFFFWQTFSVTVLGFWIPAVNSTTPIGFLTEFIYYKNPGETAGWQALALWAAVIFFGVLAYKVYKKLDKATKQSYRLIFTLAFLPMIILFVISTPPFRALYIDRYLITSAIGLAVFFGVTIALSRDFIKKEWRIASVVIMAVLFVTGIGNVWNLGNWNKNSGDTNQTREIVQIATEKSNGKQPIIAATPWLFYEATFYSTDDHPVYFLNPSSYQIGSLAMLKDSDEHKIKDIAAFSKANPTVWLVGYIRRGGLTSPSKDWHEIQKITIKDPFSGNPEYQAIQYRTN
ncbi:MAG: glycosyltransferase family 39 protein [Thiobacillus sp.]